MHWSEIVESHRGALLRVVAALFAIAGLAEGAAKATLARSTRNYLLRILRPAESAARRLIVIAARKLQGPASDEPSARSLRTGQTTRPASDEHSARSLKAGQTTHPSSICGHSRNARSHGLPASGAKKGDATARAAPAFPLLDPLKNFAPRRRYSRWFPRVTILGVTEPAPLPPVPTPGDPVAATRLCQRLAALRRALEDIDGQARRLARWQARRASAPAAPASGARLKRASGNHRFSPMRPGYPPGRRKRPVHEVDEILRNCHQLALLALSPDNTS